MFKRTENLPTSSKKLFLLFVAVLQNIRRKISSQSLRRLSFLLLLTFLAAATSAQDCIEGSRSSWVNQQETYRTIGIDRLPNESIYWFVEGGALQEQAPFGTAVTLVWGDVEKGTITYQYQNDLGETRITCQQEVQIHHLPVPCMHNSLSVQQSDCPVEDLAGCAGDTVVLRVCGDDLRVKVNWTIEKNGELYLTSRDRIVTLPNAEAGSYHVCQEMIDTLTGGRQSACSSFQLFEIPKTTLVALNHPPAQKQLTICKGNVLTFIDKTKHQQGLVSERSWQIYSLDTVPNKLLFVGNPDNHTQKYRFENPGSYKVILRRTNCIGCEAQDEILLTVKAGKTPQILSPKVICEGQSTRFTSDIVCNGSGPCCGQLEWQAWADDRLIATHTGAAFSVTWNDLPPDFSCAGRIVLIPMQCAAGICPEPITAVIPILPATIEVSGPTLGCDRDAELQYTLPQWPGAFYEWWVNPLPGSSGSIKGKAWGNLFTVQLDNFSGSFEIMAEVDHPLAGCMQATSITVGVLDFDLLGPERVCLNEQGTYQIDPPFSEEFQVNWKIGDDLFVDAGNQIEHTFYEAGIHSVVIEVLDENGQEHYCGNPFLDVVVPMAVPPVQEIAGLTDDLCRGETYNYSVDNPIPLTRIVWQLSGADGPSLRFGNSIDVSWLSPPLQLEVFREHTLTGCVSAPTKEALEFSSPVSYTIEGPTALCTDGEGVYNLLPNSPLPVAVEWSILPVGAGTILSQTDTEVEVQWYTDSSTTFEAMLIAKVTQCDGSTVSTSITVDIGLRPEVALAQLSNRSCTNELIEFFAEAWYPGVTRNLPGNFEWTVYDGEEVVVQKRGKYFAHTFLPGQGGRYQGVMVFTSTDTHCPGRISKTFELEILDFPPPYISTPFPLCGDDSQGKFLYTQDFAHLGEVTYEWSIQESGEDHPSVIDDSNRPYQEMDHHGDVTYFVKVSMGGCEKMASYAIDCETNSETCECEDPKPEITDLEWGGTCGNITLTGTLPPIGLRGYWQIVDPFYNDSGEREIAFTDELQQQVTHDFTVPGFYRMAMLADCPTNPGCLLIDRRQVQVPLIVDFDFTPVSTGNTSGKRTYAFTDHSLFLPEGFDSLGVLQTVETKQRKWTLTGPTTHTSDQPTFTVELVRGASYTVHLEVLTNIGYRCEKTMVLTVPKLPKVNIEPQQFCSGELITFTPIVDVSPQNILAYQWSVEIAGKTYLSFHENPTFSFPQSGVKKITLRVETSSGAVVETETSLKILPALLGSIIVDYEACNTAATLAFKPSQADTNLLRYQWSNGATTRQIQPLTSGYYTVTISDPNDYCQPRAYQRRVSYAEPVTLSGTREVCAGGNFDIRARRSAIPPGYTLTWHTNVATPILNNVPERQRAYRFKGVAPENVDSFVITATLVSEDENCIPLVSDHRVIVKPLPEVNLVSEVIKCNPLAISLKEASGLAVKWRDVHYKFLGNGVIIVFEPGIYYATYQENNCSVTKEIQVDLPIDFSPVLFGTYELCADQLDVQQCVPGIPGKFSYWAWVNPDNPLEPYLSGVNSTISPFCVEQHTGGPVALRIVTTQGCEGISDPFYINLSLCETSCELPEMDIKKIGCAGVDPESGRELYYVHWSVEVPRDRPCGQPCAGSDLGGIEVNGGTFLEIRGAQEPDEAENWYGFEGILAVEPGHDIEEISWTIPFCDPQTGVVCSYGVMNVYDFQGIDLCFEDVCSMDIHLNGIAAGSPTANVNQLQRLEVSYSIEDLVVGSAYTLRVYSTTGQISGNLGNGHQLPAFTATSTSFSGTTNLDWLQPQGTEFACLQFVVSNESAPWGTFCSRIFCLDLVDFTGESSGELRSEPGNQLPSKVNALNTLTVYPNPADNRVTVQLDLDPARRNQQLTITNVLGRIIKEIPWPEGTDNVQITTTELPPGVYYFLLRDGQNQAISTKVLIQH